MYWGTLLEPIVAAHYTKRTGNRVRRINAVLQHPDFDKRWMLANIDREVTGSNEVQILECKTAGEFGSRLWRDRVPEYVQLQVQHQLAVTGKRAADVAVLICGQELRVYRIDRDDDLIERLIQLEAQFWRYVETDTEPPADGSDSADLALRCLYPQDSGATVDFTLDRALSSAFADLVNLRADIDAKSQVEASLKQQIQQAMGDASKAFFETGVVTYRRSKDGSGVDTKRLFAEHPDLASIYATCKPGSRRFVIST
jgi:predicted phage-related endonuclease